MNIDGPTIGGCIGGGGFMLLAFVPFFLLWKQRQEFRGRHFAPHSPREDTGERFPTARETRPTADWQPPDDDPYWRAYVESAKGRRP